MAALQHLKHAAIPGRYPVLLAYRGSAHGSDLRRS